jgi:ATP-binding cassette subfamily B protein
VRGSGKADAIIACFQMLSKHLNFPFRREVLRKILQNQERRTGSLSLQQCGAIAESLGLNAQLISLPVSAVDDFKHRRSFNGKIVLPYFTKSINKRSF